MLSSDLAALLASCTSLEDARRPSAAAAVSSRGVLGRGLGEAAGKTAGDAAGKATGDAAGKTAAALASEEAPEARRDTRGGVLAGAAEEVGLSSGDFGDILLAGSRGVTLIGDTLLMAGERSLQVESGDRQQAPPSWP